MNQRQYSLLILLLSLISLTIGECIGLNLLINNEVITQADGGFIFIGTIVSFFWFYIWVAESGGDK